MNSAPVILWWGSDLRFFRGRNRESRKVLPNGADPALLIPELAAAEFPSDRAIRIVYQPEALETREAPPLDRPSRSRWKRRLRREIPGLGADDSVWAIEAALGRPLLQFELGSPLPGVAIGLSRRRFQVSGAWSLLSLLESAGESAGLARLDFVAGPDHSLIAFQGPTGDRWVQSHAGVDFPEGAEAALRSALASFDESSRPSGMAVIEDGPAAESLRRLCAELGRGPAHLGEVVEGIDRLAPAGPSDFLADRGGPAGRRRKLRLSGSGLGLALGIGASFLLIAGHRGRVRRENEAAMGRRLEAQARAASALLLRRRTAEGEAALARARCPPQWQAQFLLAAARRLPPACLLQSLRTDGPEFSLSGACPGADPAASAGLLNRFAAALGGGPWRLSGKPGMDDAGNFTIKGRFQPPAPESAETADLAAIVRRLSSVPGFLPDWAEWTRDWEVRPEGCELLPELEIRHYRLWPRAATIEAWPAIVATVGKLCAHPGVSIERLALVISAENPSAFAAAEMEVSVRLRR